jgi:tRNA A-37 threonylcarbamoyl transferase component Bud32
MNVVGYGISSDRISNVYWILLIHPLTLAAPLAFAYAIVRHRVFDIRVIIRQGLQYALARGAVLGLVPAMGAFLILDLAVNRQQPLVEILQNRGWLYGSISVIALVLYWRRAQWLEGIDRRFFREQYDAQQLLRDVAHEIRAAPGVEQIAFRVASRIEAALHPEFVSLLVRDPGESVFRTLASVPAARQLSIPADSKLVGLASILGKPFEVLMGDSEWLEQRLPWDEIELARQTGIDLLIPVTNTPGGKQALLVLGIRLSEEPYTRKDQELLETIAANLALLLESPSITHDRTPDSRDVHPAALTGLESLRQLGTLRPASGALAETGASRYRVLQSLGRGGMGEVFLAEDTSLERRVALKFLSEFLQEDEIARKRFIREAKSAAALDHPFICKIYETGMSQRGQVFIAMEYVEGQTLRQELAQGPLPLERSLQIVIQVTDALETAHKKGVIHRDLKPANIMITEQGHAKVMDFGLAKRLTSDDSSGQDLSLSLTREGATVGTPAYMSPEQIQTQPVDHRSDIFSLGIVFYELLTGIHPFRRSRAIETMEAILNDEAPLLSEYLPNATDLLQKTIGLMLAKDPGRRYQEASELSDDLVRVQAQAASPM